MTRYDALKVLVSLLEDELVICNLGFASRELYAIGDDPRHFYMLGSMGLASSIALGLALNTQRTVVALDGDGSVLMNLGSLVTVAHENPSNLKWIVLDNGAYESTGNQPTYTSKGTSLIELAKAVGIRDTREISVEDDVKEILRQRIKGTALSFTVVKVGRGRPASSPVPLDPLFIRSRFMDATKGPQPQRSQKR